MKLMRAIAAIVLVSAFAASVAAGTFEDAVDAHARGDYAKALRLIRSLANDGNVPAQFNLGLMYLTGRGVQQDYSAAALWFRKAAEQGYALAQSNLGTLYRDGRGVAQDDAEADRDPESPRLPLDQSGIAYLRYLRRERRQSLRIEADTDFQRAKSELVRLRIAEKQRHHPAGGSGRPHG